MAGEPRNDFCAERVGGEAEGAEEKRGAVDSARRGGEAERERVRESGDDEVQGDVGEVDGGGGQADQLVLEGLDEEREGLVNEVDVCGREVPDNVGERECVNSRVVDVVPVVIPIEKEGVGGREVGNEEGGG